MPFSAAEATKRRDEVGVDRARADEEAAAQRQPERRLDARLERADPLPRALDAALDRGVEAAAARDLEVREAGAVEDLCEPQQLGGGNPPGERLLAEQADRRVGERRHRAAAYRGRRHVRDAAAAMQECGAIGTGPGAHAAGFVSRRRDVSTVSAWMGGGSADQKGGLARREAERRRGRCRYESEGGHRARSAAGAEGQKWEARRGRCSGLRAGRPSGGRPR